MKESQEIKKIQKHTHSVYQKVEKPFFFKISKQIFKFSMGMKSDLGEMVA
jgi:hypothetical protein